jgi:hypothetical protein
MYPASRTAKTLSMTAFARGAMGCLSAAIGRRWQLANRDLSPANYV